MVADGLVLEAEEVVLAAETEVATEEALGSEVTLVGGLLAFGVTTVGGLLSTVEDVVGLDNGFRMATTIVGMSSLVNISVWRHFPEVEEVFFMKVVFLLPHSLEALQALVDILLLDSSKTL